MCVCMQNLTVTQSTYMILVLAINIGGWKSTYKRETYLIYL